MTSPVSRISWKDSPVDKSSHESNVNYYAVFFITYLFLWPQPEL